MPETETVTLRLPSGEEIDAVVPAGLSDAAIKVYTLSKRPDLFTSGLPKKGQPPLPGLAGAAQPPLPQLSPSEEMPVSQAEQNARGNVGQTLGELGGPAAAGLAIGAGGPMAAARALPTAIAGVKAIGAWAKQPQNQLLAYFLYKELKQHLGGAIRLIEGAPVPTSEPQP